VFVTDGGIALDAAWARPVTMPGEVAGGGAAIERLLAAPRPDEFTLAQLIADPNGRAYRTPSGVALNRTYVEFLRRTLPSQRVRLRAGGRVESLVITVDGQAIGVMMPLAQ
ncbi:MAG TPA: hypothetical protein VD970_06095, partial [Acetobacteraceae bacterium]|nr:hypothetical protein [Acetobacteraceae bacterium]